MKVEPVTSLKRQATKILADRHDSKKAVLITEHGRPSAYLVEVVVSPCRVFYKQDGNKVFILFVMRAERDLRKFLLSKQ